MRKFYEAANFKKATLIYLAAKLPEKDLDELRKLFISIDQNGDGKISLDEFSSSLINYGINYTEVECRALMDKLDTNNNGYIDYTEFLAGCMKSKIYLKEDYLRSAFQYFDKVIIQIFMIILGQQRFDILRRAETDPQPRRCRHSRARYRDFAA